MMELKGIDEGYVRGLLRQLRLDRGLNGQTLSSEIREERKGLLLNSNLYSLTVRGEDDQEIVRAFIKDHKPADDLYDGRVHRRGDVDKYEKRFLEFHGLLWDYSGLQRRIVMPMFDGSFEDVLLEKRREYENGSVPERNAIRESLFGEIEAIFDLIVRRTYQRTSFFKSRDKQGGLLVERLDGGQYEERLKSYLSELLRYNVRREQGREPKPVEYMSLASQATPDLRRLISFLTRTKQHALIHFDTRSPNIVWRETAEGREYELIDYGNAGMGRPEIDIATFANDYLFEGLDLNKRRLRELELSALRDLQYLFDGKINLDRLGSVGLGNILEGERMAFGGEERLASIWTLLKTAGVAALYESNFRKNYEDFVDRSEGVYSNDLFISSRLKRLSEVLDEGEGFENLKRVVKSLTIKDRNTPIRGNGLNGHPNDPGGNPFKPKVSNGSVVAA